MWSEERHGLVAPVVHHARGARLDVELKHWQQLDRRNAQRAQIRDLLYQAGVGAAHSFVHARVRVAREPADVHLVDDRARRRQIERGVAFPVVARRIHHHALHRRRCVVALAARGLAGIPVRHDHLEAVRVDHELRRVESKPTGGVRRTGDAVAVNLPGRICPARTCASSGRCGSRRGRARSRAKASRRLSIEKHERDAGRTAGEKAEVDAVLNDGGAKRTADARAFGKGHTVPGSGSTVAHCERQDATASPNSNSRATPLLEGWTSFTAFPAESFGAASEKPEALPGGRLRDRRSLRGGTERSDVGCRSETWSFDVLVEEGR